jgi:predicted MPP superfamily phosphohydrolase
MRLPYIGGLYSRYGFFAAYSGGLYFETEQSTLVLSRGLAGVLKIPRLFNRRDIPVVTLRLES